MSFASFFSRRVGRLSSPGCSIVQHRGPYPCALMRESASADPKLATPQPARKNAVDLTGLFHAKVGLGCKQVERTSMSMSMSSSSEAIVAGSAARTTTASEWTNRLLCELRSHWNRRPAWTLGIIVRGFMAHPDSAMLARYASAVAERKLVIPIAKKLPLGSAREAQKFAETKYPGGKALLLG